MNNPLYTKIDNSSSSFPCGPKGRAHPLHPLYLITARPVQRNCLVVEVLCKDSGRGDTTRLVGAPSPARRPGAKAPPVERLPVEPDGPRGEAPAALRHHRGLHGPVPDPDMDGADPGANGRCEATAGGGVRRLPDALRGRRAVPAPPSGRPIHVHQPRGYGTAKGALINMTRELACELAPQGITVNAIAPGFIDTPLSIEPDGGHAHETPLFRDVYIGGGFIPLRRDGEPDDIAGPAAFLCGPDSAYVTGQILCVDGGLSATF